MGWDASRALAFHTTSSRPAPLPLPFKPPELAEGQRVRPSELSWSDQVDSGAVRCMPRGNLISLPPASPFSPVCARLPLCCTTRRYSQRALKLRLRTRLPAPAKSHARPLCRRELLGSPDCAVLTIPFRCRERGPRA